jgi:Icc-related predicted phosphoesterase
MRFLVLGCLHGQIPRIHYKRFDAVIACGDFCSDAHRKFMFEAIKHNLADQKNQLTWVDIVGEKEARHLVAQSVRDGRRVLQHLNTLGVPVYVVPGNNDWTGYDSSFSVARKNHYHSMLKGLKNIVDIHRKAIVVDEYMLVGYGISHGPEYPQYREDIRRFTKRQLMEKKREYERALRTYEKKFNTPRPVVFVSHNVPYGTKIDVIRNKYSPRNGQHFGSLLVRDLVKKHQPVVCLGAHMHEHFEAIKMGKTPCVNAGYGANCNVLLEIKPGEGKLSFHGKAQKY